MSTPPNVVDLNDYRPHMVVTLDATVHVLPMQLLHDVAAGMREVDVLPPEVWRGILRDFLLLNAECPA